MTLRYPKALWHPLPEADRQPSIVPTQGIAHTVVGHGNPYGTFDAPGNGDESHEWLPFEGDAEQYVSLDRSADANFHANRRADGTGAWSVETQDHGAATLDDTPWSDHQCDELVERMVWGNDPEGLVAAFQALHGVTIAPIPLVLCPDPDAPGWGYHSLWRDRPGGNPWTKYQGKTCPGRARIAQFPGLLDRARDLRSAAHSAGATFNPPTSQEDPMYAVRNRQTGEIRVAAERAGLGGSLTWDGFLDLENTKIIGPPPEPDPNDNADGNVAGRRWANVSPDAFTALPGARS